MKEHVLITLPSCGNLQISRTTAFDLDTAPCLLLDVFHIGTTVTDDLCAKVESGQRLELDGNLLLGPFALSRLSIEEVP